MGVGFKSEPNLRAGENPSKGIPPVKDEYKNYWDYRGKKNRGKT